MKTHLHPVRWTGHLILAVLAFAAAASVSAQTTITTNMMAPPGMYNTSSTGFVMRVHQIAVTRTPGDQNSIGNVLKELSGGFGPSIATNGPLTGGFWREDYLNYLINDQVLTDAQWKGNFTPYTNQFPGLATDTNVTHNVSSFAYDILTCLRLPAGTNYLVVGAGDSVRVTIGGGDNPNDLGRTVQLGQLNNSRGFDTNFMTLNVETAGVYPVRIVFGQGGDHIGGLQFYSLREDNFWEPYLVNDRTNSAGYELTSYQPVLPLAPPSLAYLTGMSPEPGAAGVSPLPVVDVWYTDGAVTTVTNVSFFSFDGVPVTPTITKTGAVTHVIYAVPSLLPQKVGTNTANYNYTNIVLVQDSAGTVISNGWTFTVGDIKTLSASYAYPAGSGDATQRGIAGRIHQGRAAANGSYSIKYGNAQIEGQQVDGAGPLINVVVTNGNPIIGAGWTGTRPADAGGGPADARTFTETNVVNYSILDGTGAVMDTGNFNSVNGYPDALFPGLPGSDDNNFTNYANSGEIAVELLAFLELTNGLQQIGVNCGDGFQLAVSAHNAKDIFREELIKIENSRAADNSTITVFVETNGLYSFRVIYRVYRDSVANSLEWFTQNPLNPEIRWLINGTNAAAVKAYRALTVPTRVYVKSVSPAPSSTGVSPTGAVSVVLVDAANIAPPVLKVNNSTVAYTATTNGNEVTLTYKPGSPFAEGQTVKCEVQYGGLIGKWSYVVRSGYEVLYVTAGSGTGGDAALIDRLASKYGLDVKVTVEGAVGPDASSLSLASNKVLIVIASPISSGSVAAWARNYMSNSVLTVPVMTWEYGNVDEWAFNTDNSAGGGAGSSNPIITNSPAYLTAGLTNGPHVVRTNGGGMNVGSGPLAPGAIAAAYQNPPGNPMVVGILEGTTLTHPLYGTVTHHSRKLFFGLVDNDSGAYLTEEGWALFDAAIEWLLPPKLKHAQGPGAGQLTLFWTSGTLLTASNLTTSPWITAPSQANPQTVSGTEKGRYYRLLKNN